MSDIGSTYNMPSGMTGAGGGNKLRLTGMATGLDVDSMIKKMMAVEQMKVDKVKQDQQLIKWRQEAYQDIIKDIKDLQSSFFDTTNSSKNILSSVNFSPFDVTGGDNSVANVTAGVGAQAGTYKIKVNQLATGAGVTNDLIGKSLSTKLKDIDGGLTDSIKLVLNTGSSDINIALDNSSSGKNGEATLGDLVNAINNQSSGAVKASFSELTGKFSLMTSATGKEASLTIKSGSTDKLSSILGSYTEEVSIKNGINADLTITAPGGSVHFTDTDTNYPGKATNSFTIDGVSYNLTGVGESTVTIGANTDKVYDKIKSFIDKYNDVVDKIQTKLNEKKNYDYKPLTDEQKASMKDTEITAWETKAKTGILRKDDNLQNMLTNLRSAFTTAVTNAGLSFGKYSSNSIGLDMSTDYQKPAHVDIVDDSKLKAAIAKNGEQILKMFTNISTSEDKTTAFNENGIFTRIKGIFQDNVGLTNTSLNSAILTKYANKQDDFSMTGSSGSNTLPNQIYQKQLLITEMNKSLAKKQEKYYQQFSRLETAMNQLNAQQSQLMQMLGQ